MIHMYKDQPVGGAIPFQVIPLETDEEYEALTPAQKSDPTKAYLIEEGVVMSGEIDDNDISASKAWSSQKTNNEIQAVNEDVTTINGEITDIQGDISTLNSAKADKMTLLWTNPSPSTPISSQTKIELSNLSNYDELKIVTAQGITHMKVGSYAWIVSVNSPGGVFYIWSRYMYSSGNDFYVMPCYMVKISDGTYSVDGNAAIPQYIYGIKY